MNKISCNYTKHGNENITITAFFNYYIPKTERGTIFKLTRKYKIEMKVIFILKYITSHFDISSYKILPNFLNKKQFF